MLTVRGIYCIENWSGRRANKNSVLPVLEFLATSGTARFIHERVSTLDELEHRVDDWAPRKQYPVGYLALHGSPQSVWVGRHELTLNDLLLLDQEDGTTPVDLRGKTLSLASCSTVATRPSALRDIVDRTRVNTLCGYASDVEWFEAAAFDLLVLSALANYSRTSDAFKYLHRAHGPFLRRMRFKSQPQWKPVPRRT